MLLSMSETESLRVSEIFDSIEGEGKRAGELATFIRLVGCNLRCSYCDSTYSFMGGEVLTLEDILSQVHYSNVTITGGEPLLQNLHPLLKKLQSNMVNIETNGSIDIRPYLSMSHVFFTIDYKCGSSGMNDKMFHQNFRELRKRDVLKFVVGSRADLEQAYKFYTKHAKALRDCKIYVSPVFGEIEPVEIVDFMKKHNLRSWRMQLQLHKFIWNPDKRGV